MMRMGKRAYKDSSTPSLFMTWLFIRCVIIVSFITLGNENKTSSLDTDSQLLLGCKPQRQKQNLPPVGLSLKPGLLMAINQSMFLCTWQLYVARALLHSEPRMPSCLLFGSHGSETLWDTLRCRDSTSCAPMAVGDHRGSNMPSIVPITGGRDGKRTGRRVSVPYICQAEESLDF